MTFKLLIGRKALLTGALATALLTAPASAFADDGNGQTPGLISVSAEGVATAVPDMAIISLSVVREAETAREALDANNEAMASVLGAFEAKGIAESDLQTGTFSIQPRWFYPDNNNSRKPEPPSIVGYTVTNTISVRVRELEPLGDILDTSINLGVNQGGNVFFTNDNQEAILTEARLNAIDKAKAKATLMTEALGVGLGRITQIAENSHSAGPMQMMQAEMAMASRASDSVPMAPGENEYRITVNITWEIEQ